MEPAVADRLVRGLLIAPIALHHQLAAHQYFAVFREADLHIGHRRADGVDPDPVRRVAADHRRGLRLAITLHDAKSERCKKQADIQIEWRAARHHGLEPTAETLPHFVAHQLFEHPIGNTRAEPQPVHHARRKIFDNRVAPGRQFQHQLSALLRPCVDRHSQLVPVEVRKIRLRRCAILLQVLGLDLDHLRSLESQKQRRDRAGEHPCEI